MGWRDLLQTQDETFVSAWVGGRTIRTHARTFKLDGREPAEHGWHQFAVRASRKARWQAPAEAPANVLRDVMSGYLVGNCLLPDDVRVATDVAKLRLERVHIIEPGLDRFVRIRAGRVYDDGPLIFAGQEFPLGPEDQVLAAYLDDKASVSHIAGVSPALDSAFRIEHWRRTEGLRARRRREIRERLGDGKLRRELANTDFAEAAIAALRVGGAHYLDHRCATRDGEMVVRFRIDAQRFECTCERTTLRIIDSGICLIDHETDERGDTYFTLESLPGVIRQARREGRLVVFRHID